MTHVIIPSDKEFAKEQQLDPKINPIIRYLEKRELPEDDKLAKQVLQWGKHVVLHSKHKILCVISKMGILKQEFLQ